MKRYDWIETKMKKLKSGNGWNVFVYDEQWEGRMTEYKGERVILEWMLAVVTE